MEVKVIKERISREELRSIAEKGYGSVVKIAVDIEKKIIALGGELHSDCQEALIKKGSQTKDIWGANVLLGKPKEQRIEFVALINIRPVFGHYDMEIKSLEIKEKIKQVINQLIE